MKRFIIFGSILCTVILILPAMLVLFSNEQENVTSQMQTMGEHQAVEQLEHPGSDVSVHVYRSSSEKVEEVPLEDYVVGVVASEMPANFEVEALKAQALTARTYILQQMLQPADIELPEGAVVTDTVSHQVYHNDEELRELWGKEYEWKIARIREAVFSTQSQILTYEGEPITAAFFSTSNGYTENSEDYWLSPIPYLRSVESPWDQNSPRFTGEKIISVSEFQTKLGVTLPADGSVGTIVARTDGGRVATVNVSGKELSGREIRDLLGLDSSDFQWRRQGEEIVIETKGWGHGVGMSQYGADGMARGGSDYKEIVNHYYRGVTIDTIDVYEEKLTAYIE
ncbi:stage II sporulation protein D [Halalkalibacterium ligniniphilum]|uniref:stage II sporulation protein D n=1 Tax=Halalkalibacterium ligniniphilum TaxID=1134413 RepID=UPI00034B0251|nr:stage II sporulation protein D [Halalkalibacterium ligniniphilum]